MKLFNVPLSVELPPDMEEQYKRANAPRFLPFLRGGATLAFFCYPVWLLWDHHFGTLQSFSEALLIRFCTMAYFAGVVALSFRPRAAQYANLLGGLTLVVTCWTTCATLGLVSNGVILGSGITLLPLVVAPIMTDFGIAMITIAISVAVIEGYMLAGHAPHEVLFSANFSMMTLTLLIGTLVYLNIQLRRASFRTEINLERARCEAEAASRAKSEFLATMSHEVRTPLNGILGILSLLKDTALDARQRDYVETVRYSGDTLLTILNDILDFSKMEAGKFDIEAVDFSMEKLIASVIALMKGRADEKGLKLSSYISKDIPRYARGDVTRLRQVLLNLVSNAIKFTPTGRVTLRVEQKAALTRFSVEDTGMGISDADQKKLFKEFSQADSSVSRRFGGTGLGLAICRKIVELMKGDLGVISRTGEGSTFWFEIPLEPAASPQATEEEAGGSGLPLLKPLSVLVAEDNKVNQKVIAGLLEKGGHGFMIAADGAEALDYLKSGAKKFDLVLMDMQMPLVDGLTATQEIRKLSAPEKDIPVIALTANAVRGDELRCLSAGMNDYVSKPINPEALFRAMARQVPSAVLQQGAPAKPAVPPPPKLALENLANIEKMMGKEYVAGFVNDGIAEVGRLVGAIEGGAASADADAMRRSAHELKAMSAMFGLSDVQALAEGIEMCCADRRLEEAQRLGGRLKDSYATGVTALRQVLPAAGWAH